MASAFTQIDADVLAYIALYYAGHNILLLLEVLIKQNFYALPHGSSVKSRSWHSG